MLVKLLDLLEGSLSLSWYLGSIIAMLGERDPRRIGFYVEEYVDLCFSVLCGSVDLHKADILALIDLFCKK
jgi:hypothetical protein